MKANKSKKIVAPAKVKAPAAKAAPKKAAGGVEGILGAFGAREGTNRAKLLARLARDIGRPVPVADLCVAVYGKVDAYGPLSMVIGGALVMIEKRKPGYVIEKSGERGALAFTMSAKR